MTKSSPGDFDGDSFSGTANMLAPQFIAKRSFKRISKGRTLRERVLLVVELSDVGSARVRNMSKRRAKILVSRYTSPVICYDDRNGLLVSSKRYGKPHIKRLSVNTITMGIHGTPLTNLFAEWVKVLMPS